MQLPGKMQLQRKENYDLVSEKKMEGIVPKNQKAAPLLLILLTVSPTLTRPRPTTAQIHPLLLQTRPAADQFQSAALQIRLPALHPLTVCPALRMLSPQKAAVSL